MVSKMFSHPLDAWGNLERQAGLGDHFSITEGKMDTQQAELLAQGRTTS